MAERVDVCIVGSGFGGSIAAWRLAELYRAAGRGPERAACWSAGSARATPTSASRWTSTTSPTSTQLIQGQGAQIVVADLVGGGSNLYLAASLRAPGRPSSAATTGPTTAPTGACGRAGSAAARSNPFYRRARRGCGFASPAWKEVSKSGGLWAATLDDAGHTCDRVPLAIDFDRCVDAKWCYTGLRLRRQELADHQLPRLGRAGRRRGPAAGRRSTRSRSPRPVPTATWSRRQPDRSADPAAGRSRSRTIECKVLILAAGAMGTAPILMRSQQSGRAAGSSQLAARPPPRRQRRPRRRGRVRLEAGAPGARPARRARSSSRASRSRR